MAVNISENGVLGDSGVSEMTVAICCSMAAKMFVALGIRLGGKHSIWRALRARGGARSVFIETVLKACRAGFSASRRWRGGLLEK